jgi:predicted transcriptional regulator
MARLQIDIDPAIKQRLKIHAVRIDTTMSEIIEQALRAYLPVEGSSK